MRLLAVDGDDLSSPRAGPQERYLGVLPRRTDLGGWPVEVSAASNHSCSVWPAPYIFARRGSHRLDLSITNIFGWQIAGFGYVWV